METRDASTEEIRTSDASPSAASASSSRLGVVPSSNRSARLSRSNTNAPNASPVSAALATSAASCTVPGQNATRPSSSAAMAPPSGATTTTTPFSSAAAAASPRSTASAPPPRGACTLAVPSRSTRHAHPASGSMHTRVPSACTARNFPSPGLPRKKSGWRTTNVKSSRDVTSAPVSGSVVVADSARRRRLGGGVRTSPGRGSGSRPVFFTINFGAPSSSRIGSPFSSSSGLNVGFPSSSRIGSPFSSTSGTCSGTYSYGSPCDHRAPASLVPSHTVPSAARRETFPLGCKISTAPSERYRAVAPSGNTTRLVSSGKLDAFKTDPRPRPAASGPRAATRCTTRLWVVTATHRPDDAVCCAKTGLRGAGSGSGAGSYVGFPSSSNTGSPSSRNTGTGAGFFTIHFGTPSSSRIGSPFSSSSGLNVGFPSSSRIGSPFSSNSGSYSGSGSGSAGARATTTDAPESFPNVATTLAPRKPTRAPPNATVGAPSGPIVTVAPFGGYARAVAPSNALVAASTSYAVAGMGTSGGGAFAASSSARRSASSSVASDPSHAQSAASSCAASLSASSSSASRRASSSASRRASSRASSFASSRARRAVGESAARLDSSAASRAYSSSSANRAASSSANRASRSASRRRASAARYSSWYSLHVNARFNADVVVSSCGPACMTVTSASSGAWYARRAHGRSSLAAA